MCQVSAQCSAWGKTRTGKLLGVHHIEKCSLSGFVPVPAGLGDSTSFTPLTLASALMYSVALIPHPTLQVEKHQYKPVKDAWDCKTSPKPQRQQVGCLLGLFQTPEMSVIKLFLKKNYLNLLPYYVRGTEDGQISHHWLSSAYSTCWLAYSPMSKPRDEKLIQSSRTDGRDLTLQAFTFYLQWSTFTGSQHCGWNWDSNPIWDTGISTYSSELDKTSTPIKLFHCTLHFEGRSICFYLF